MGVAVTWLAHGCSQVHQSVGGCRGMSAGCIYERHFCMQDEERLIPRSRDRQDYAAHSASELPWLQSHTQLMMSLLYTDIVDQLLQASSSSDTYTTPSSTVQALV